MKEIILGLLKDKAYDQLKNILKYPKVKQKPAMVESPGHTSL